MLVLLDRLPWHPLLLGFQFLYTPGLKAFEIFLLHQANQNFEETARTLDIPGGTKMIQEYYRQMRKFGCNILAVVQQYDIIKDSAVRGAMIGNSKMLSIVGFGDQQKLAPQVINSPS
jgi:hypothetical protein